MGETIFGAIDWLREKLGWFKASLLVAILTVSYMGFSNYQSELHYHKWAGSFIAHQYDDVRYEDGYVQIHWTRLPKIPREAIEIHYLFYRPGLPLIGTEAQYLPIDESNAYRNGLDEDDMNLHLVPYWGSPLFVGDLPPGKYELVVYYRYVDSWWYPDWSADQRIVFIVEE